MIIDLVVNVQIHVHLKFNNSKITQKENDLLFKF